MALFHHALLWAAAVVAQSYDIAQGLAWSWPLGSFLRLAEERHLNYQRATVSAGKAILGLEITIPNYQCVERVNNSEADGYDLTLRLRPGADVVEAILHLEADNASLFLGPSLDDGYELDLAGIAYIRRTQGEVSLGASEVAVTGGGARDFWISWAFLQNTATLRVYSGSTPQESQLLLSYFDTVPPAEYLLGMHLWLRGEGDWRLCPAGLSRPSMTAQIHQRPLLKLVETDAVAVDCEGDAQDVPKVADLADVALRLWPLELALSGEHRLVSSANFTIEQGGLYQLCYAPDGSNDCTCVGGFCSCSRTREACLPSVERSFGSCNPFSGASAARSSLLFAEVMAHGIAGPCNTTGCLAREAWDCHFSLGPGVLCPLDVHRFGWRLWGRGRATWGAAFAPDALQLSGQLLMENPTSCGSTAADLFEANSSFLDIFPEVQSSTIPAVKRGIAVAFTVPLCYCPISMENSCASAEEFVQPFGRLYMWVAYICDRGDACISSYFRVVPGQRFVTKIWCPPGGGCLGSDLNRLKFVEAESTQLPSWDPRAPCRSREPVHAMGHGGQRVDFKLWAESRVNLSAQPQRNFHMCYCNSGCDHSSNWLQVGSVSTVFALAFASTSSGALPLETIRYANKPGALTFFAGISSQGQNQVLPYDSNRFQGDAVLKLLSFDRQGEDGSPTLAEQYDVKKSGQAKLKAGLEQQCSLKGFDTSIGGLETAAAAAQRRGSAGELSYRLTFGTQSSPLVPQAGTLVVCYCAQLTTTSECSGTWFYMGLLQISGPKGGQSWVLPTKVVVEIADIQGWGFRPDDRLRLADKGVSCLGASSSSAYKVDCISNSTLCRSAQEDELVNIHLTSNLQSQVHLSSIQVESESSSILTFTAPVAELLQDGDAIYLDPGGILINGQPLAAASELEQFAAMELAGMGQFQDDTSKTFLQHWHYVQLLSAEDGSIEATSRVRIPIGWSSTDPAGLPAFSFLPGQLQWFRSNVLNSQDLKADRLVTDLPVCWAPNEGTGANFYGSAGTVSFTDPPVMGGARVALSARRSGSRAPILISFSPSRSIGEYQRTMGQMLLGLRFLNTSLQPAMASQNFSQASCGHIFSELWSDAVGGFPVPMGCWINDLGQNGELEQREVFILFNRITGLRNQCTGTSCTYQLVLDAIATDLTVAQPILDIDVACSFPHGGCARRHQIIERGTLLAETSTSPAADVVTSISLENTGGDGVLQWNGVLGLRLTTTSPIQQGQYVRLFLTPFTQWSFTSSCTAHCAAPGSCSATCAVQRLLPSVFASELERYAVLKLQLPTVDLAAPAHVLTVSDLPMPKGAVFPAPVSAEVSTVLDTEPQYLPVGHVASGFGHGADATDATARFVRSGRHGSGPRPFVGQRNLLYAYLTMAATTGSSSLLQIQPPAGFACDLLGPAADPVASAPREAEPPLLRQSEAPFDGELATLLLLDRDLDSFPDFIRGALSMDGSESSVGDTMCQYSFGAQKVYTGQHLLLALEVLNPPVVVKQTDVNNVWSVHLRSAGALSGTVYDLTWNFSVAATAELWTPNVAVLGQLQATLQPQWFHPGAANQLTVLLRAQQEVAPNAILVIDAPLYFDLSGCELQGSPSRPMAAVPVLPLAPGCSVSQTPWQRTRGSQKNRALLGMEGWMRTAVTYEFQLMVTNPLNQVGEGSDDGFFIWTQHSTGPVDSTMAPIGMLEGQTESWQIYPETWAEVPSFKVLSGVLKPFSTFGVAESLVIEGLRPGHWRLTAPEGVRFRPSATEVQGTLTSSRRLAAVLLPPSWQPQQLIWDAAKLEPGIYSFKVWFDVVPTAAASSAPSFFLEMNPGPSALPSGARRYAAPPLRRVLAQRSCAELSFSVQLPALPEDSYMVIQAESAPPGLSIACPMVAETSMAKSLPLPEGTTCEARSSGAPWWRLASPAAWPAGLYVLRGQGSHGVSVGWTLGTYQLRGGWEVALDAPAFVPGCKLSEVLPSTFDASMANRKPSQWTQVAFTLELPEAVPKGSSLAVHTPAGYVLRADCSPDLGNESAWLGRCIGQGETAEVQIREDLSAGRHSFSLRVKNPANQPAMNWWLLELDRFTSKPLDGYPLAQIRFPRPLEAVNAACGLEISAPVGIFFVLQQPLSSRGSLQLTAAPGHVLDDVVDVEGALSGAHVEERSGNRATVRISMELLAGATYSLYILASNPSLVPDENTDRYWTLESKSPTGDPLDQGQVASFQLFPAADLRVVNMGQDYSNQEIRVSFTATLPAPVLFADLLLFQAPSGFPMSDFQWPETAEEGPVPAAEITCHFGPCILALSFSSSWQLPGSVAYTGSMTFTVASRNPAVQGSGSALSWWRLEHLRDHMALAKAVALSWRWRPELRSVSLQLLGPSLAALSVSTLRLSFVPESSAVALRLVAEWPPDLSFATAAVQAPKGAPESVAELLLSGLSLVPDVEASIVIASVQLGRGGGQSRWSLQTFRSSWEGVVDERLNFQGFYQAGSVEVQGYLQGPHSSEDSTPWLRQLPPRAAERGSITLTLVFSMDLHAGDVLRVTCQGLGAYEIFGRSLMMSSRGFDLAQGEVIPVEVENQGLHQVSIVLSGNGTVRVIQAAQFVQLQFQAVPTAEANTWKVESYSGNVLSNTNDGSFGGFQPVLQLLVELAPLRSPPNARISVNLQVSTLTPTVRMTQLSLVAPPGFRFPPLCGDLCSSFGEFFEDTDRALATLSSSESLLGHQLTFEVSTPITTPQVLTWLIRGYGATGELQAWGVAPGFKVNQMLAEVWYGGVAGLSAELAVVLTLDLPTPPAQLKILELLAPAELKLSCRGNAMKALNLPQAECASEGLGALRLELGASLQTGTYSFSVTAALPLSTPPQNEFSIIIRQQPTENVVDATFGLAGWPLVELTTSQPILAWTTAQLGELSTVTVSFSVRKATAELRALLFNLPEFYEHRIRGPSEFKVSNPRLPLLKGATDWLDVSQLDRIVVNLEPEDPMVAVGSYLFTFPVALPLSSLPSVNLWRLSLCSARSCVSPTDKEVLVSFPMAGFAPGEVSALEQRRQELAREADTREETASAALLCNWLVPLFALLATWRP